MKVFVSGCYDILHANHLEFFRQAKKLGDYLIVSIASNRIITNLKGREPILPESHRLELVKCLEMVDEAFISDGKDNILNFEEDFLRTSPDILVSTNDDKHQEIKKELCKKIGARYINISKCYLSDKLSSTDINRKVEHRVKTPNTAPLRVDFAGGWLDVPKFSNPNSFVVNCAIQPVVSLKNWPYEIGSGLGGSAAYSYLKGENPIDSELNSGVGWQDPMIIMETGLCAWRATPKPKLAIKVNPNDMLSHKMILVWTGKNHKSSNYVDIERDYGKIASAGVVAYSALTLLDYKMLCTAVNMSYSIQLEEGMQELKSYNEVAKKYCGGGYGGYALYLFGSSSARHEFAKNTDGIIIEPYLR